MSSEVWVRKSDFRKAIDSHVGVDVLENSLGGKDQADGQADQEYRLRTPPWSNHPGPQRSIGFMFHACRAQQQHYNRPSITALARKRAMLSVDQGLYSRLIRLHLLLHACHEPIFDVGMIEELGMKAQIMPCESRSEEHTSEL